ncbi:MAG: MFS transporter [Acidimicrobiia bacterium]|nr:MFS transporter [Acidimicrobiia bacterium]
MTERQLQIAIGLPVLLGALDLTVISAILPSVVSELDLPVPGGIRQASWLVTGYLVAYAIGILAAGRLSDRHGAGPVLRWGLVLFALGSVAVAVSGPWSTRLVQQVAYRSLEARPAAEFVGLWVLVASRSVQALAAGAIVPAGMSYGWKQLGSSRWLGFVAAVDLAGWTLGHLYGGIIVRLADWRLAFWINLPFVALSLFMLRSMQSSPSRQVVMPWTRVALIGFGIAATMVGIGGVEGSVTAVQPVWLVVGVVATVAGFVGDVNGLVPLRTSLRNPAVLLANVTLGFVVFLVLALVPLFVSVLIEADTERAGWLSGWMLSAFTVPMAVMAWWSSRAQRRSLQWVAAIGGVVGFVMASRWEPRLAGLVPGLLVLGVSLGVWFGPLAERVLQAVPAESSGGGSAVVILSRLVGMAIGTATLTNFVLSKVPAVTTADALIADLLTVFHDAALLGVAGCVLLAGLALRSGRQPVPSL